jgi:hypothetical protein
LEYLAERQTKNYMNTKSVAKDEYAIYIRKMVYNDSMNIMAWILSDSSTYLIQRKQDPWMVLETTSSSTYSVDSIELMADVDHVEWKLQRIDSDDSEISEKLKCSTCIALNSEFKMLAIGEESGSIYVYRINETISKDICFSHLLSYNYIEGAISMDHRFPGKVTNIEWTTEGHALAASYEYGLAIWSVFGYLLTSNFGDTVALK